jgi:hypothetical protein
MASGSDANTVKILRLSPKRPLCAMQSKLTHQGFDLLPGNTEGMGERQAGWGPEFARQRPSKCDSLLR